MYMQRQGTFLVNLPKTFPFLLQRHSMFFNLLINSSDVFSTAT